MTGVTLTDQFFILTTPAISSVLSIVFIFMRFPVWKQMRHTCLRAVLFFYMLSTAVNWSLSFMMVNDPHLFKYFRPLAVITYILVPLFLYHFIFIITRTSREEKWSVWHYVIPFTLITVFIAWMASVPMEVHLGTSVLERRMVSGYESFYWAFAMVAFVRLAYTTFYLVLSVLRFKRYQRSVKDYSADLSLMSLHWMKIFLVLAVFSLLVPLLIALIPTRMFIRSLGFLIPALMVLAQNILLCFNILRLNFVYMGEEEAVRKEPSQQADMTEEEKADSNKVRQPLTHKLLSDYLSTKKPYLNPSLKITDITRPLHTNRSTLSAFINQHYGISFSRLINDYRLNELDSLMADPNQSQLTNQALIQEAGFGSYQSYYRAKQQAKEMKNEE